MTTVLNAFKWFYHAFGINAIHETGRNAYLVILARTLRMVAHGANSLVLGLFLSELKFSDYRIGLFLTLTLLGDVFLGGFLTLIADRVGRRKILLAGSLLMISSGFVFSQISNFWILLTAAVFGVVSATGGDFGPFRSVEESIISHLTTPETRADVLSWYVTTSTLGSAVGSEASGRIVHYLQDLDGWTLADAYHALFWAYVVMGSLNAVLMLFLTKECEVAEDDMPYSRVPQNDNERNAVAEDAVPLTNGSSSERKQSRYKRFFSSFSSNFSAISASTRSVMYKLWFLLAVDSIADGMVPYSLTNYYIDEKFHPAKSTLGDATGAAYLLGSISTIFAGPLVRKIGLVGTMVYTHIPSSVSVLVFPAPNNLWLTIILLFIRAGLNNLDQAPRAALIAAVVKPSERTSVMGITSMVRTLAAMVGPTVTGVLAGNQKFWIAFVAAGAFRIAYDLGLYVMFKNIKLFQNEETKETTEATSNLYQVGDDEEGLELEELEEDDDEHERSKGLDNSFDESTKRSQ